MYRHLPGIRLILDGSLMEMAFLLTSFQISLTAERRHNRPCVPSSEFHFHALIMFLIYYAHLQWRLCTYTADPISINTIPPLQQWCIHIQPTTTVAISDALSSRCCHCHHFTHDITIAIFSTSYHENFFISPHLLQRIHPWSNSVVSISPVLLLSPLLYFWKYFTTTTITTVPLLYPCPYHLWHLHLTLDTTIVIISIPIPYHHHHHFHNLISTTNLSIIPVPLIIYSPLYHLHYLHHLYITATISISPVLPLLYPQFLYHHRFFIFPLHNLPVTTTIYILF